LVNFSVSLVLPPLAPREILLISFHPSIRKFNAQKFRSLRIFEFAQTNSDKNDMLKFICVVVVVVAERWYKLLTALIYIARLSSSS